MSGGWPRRTFLQGAAGLPALKRLGGFLGPQGTGASAASAKFTPIPLDRFYNASAAAFGPREQSHPDSLIRMPGGRRDLRGIPFELGPEDVQQKSWITLSTRQPGWAAGQAEVPIGSAANYLCLASFCDWTALRANPTRLEDAPTIGKLLAEASILYEDGTEHTAPIRCRFETNPPTVPWGFRAYQALAHPQFLPRPLEDALKHANEWGDLQTAVEEEPASTNLWIWAFANPHPEKSIRVLRLVAKSEDLAAVCGLTLFHGTEHPLRYGRLFVYRLTLPEPAAEDANRWRIVVDLGVVARTQVLPEFDSTAWLANPTAAIGEDWNKVTHGRHIYAEISAAGDASLTLHDNQTKSDYVFDLASAAEGAELPAKNGGASIQLVQRDKAWLNCKVIDTSTGKPTPVRLAFRSKAGMYLPPYAHRVEINQAWFQDYGADLQQWDSSYAYVDGVFPAELPVGEVYVEMIKGFEYEPVRQRLDIRPDQTELTLELRRFTDLRSKGWVTADTHVHFLSPTTALLEGQAEGLNLINLLAAQWGGLFTNIGDFPYGNLSTPDGEMLVRTGTENRSHLLGHMNLLGNKTPIVPFSASSPNGWDDCYFGDPLWMTMSDWADECRRRDGVVVAPHFPYPDGELAADIVTGKIDAIELMPQNSFNQMNYFEYYRYLNCGYRLPAVGGTDKMRSGTAVGRCRTYAHIGDEPFSFDAWAKAVRSGRTFVSSGPLLFFLVDGHPPGDAITLGRNGGTVEVEVRATGALPIRRVEVVLNGHVVATRTDMSGPRELILREKVEVKSAGWIAARCESQLTATVPWAWFYRRPAHSSPVYLQVPGQEPFSESAANYFLNLIDGTQLWAQTLATRPDAQRYAHVLKVLSDAHDTLHRRMHAHGVKH